MTTERIDIVVTERGSRKASAAIAGIGTKSEKSSKSVARLERALQGVGAGLIIRSIAQIADEYTNMQNRLKIVTEGTQELGAVTAKLFDIANETRTAFRSTAELYTRTALATKELGLSQQETLNFTQSLNKAIILSGASTIEATAGIIQLSQGLASGTLRGDELRSVLEQLPKVAEVIAKGLGVTRGELRKLGTEGKITTADIIRSFKESKTEIDKLFEQTVPTISQSFAILRNNVVELLGKFDEATGISSNFSKALILIANNLEEISKALLFATGLLLLFKLQALAAFGVAVITSVVGATTAFFSLAVAVGSVSGAMALLVTFMAGPAGLVGIMVVVAGAAFVFRKQLQATIVAGMAEVTIAVDNTVVALKRFGDFVVGGGLGKLFAVTAAKFGFIDEDALRQVLEEDKKKYLNLTGKTAEDIRSEANKKITELALGDQFELPSFDFNQKGIDTTISPEVKALLERQKDLLEDLNKPQQEYIDGLADLDALLKTGKISQEEYTNTLLDFQIAAAATGTSLQAGIHQGILAINKDFNDLASVVKSSMVDGLKEAEDAFIEFTKTGKFQFKDLARSIIEDLQRIALKRTASNIFSSLIGPALGAVAGKFGGNIGTPVQSAGGVNIPQAKPNQFQRLLGSVPGFATGGSFQVGGSGGTDSQLVAFRASPNETVEIKTPNQQGSGGDSFHFNFQIDASGGEDVDQRIGLALNQAKSGIVSAAVSAVRDNNRRNPNFLRT